NLPPRYRSTPLFGEHQSYCVPAAPRCTSLPRRAACERIVHLFARSPSLSSMTSALRIRRELLSLTRPLNLRQRSFRFCPPRCYQASQAGTSSLLRLHLPPRTDCGLGFHLAPQPPASPDSVSGFPGYCAGSLL